MTLDMQELEQWAHGHETDMRIAKAIYELASGDIESMQSICEDPTQYEVEFVAERIPDVEQDDAFWGWDSLAKLVREVRV